MTLHHCFSECICVPFSDINGGVVPRECIDSDADLPDLLRHRRYPEFRACDDASVAITRAKKANQLGIETGFLELMCFAVRFLSILVIS